MRTFIAFLFISLAFALGFFISSIIYLHGNNVTSHLLRVSNMLVDEENNILNDTNNNNNKFDDLIFEEQQQNEKENKEEEIAQHQEFRVINEYSDIMEYEQTVLTEQEQKEQQKIKSIPVKKPLFKAQYFQDEAVLRLMGWIDKKYVNNEKNQKKGFFIEFGAGDGRLHSNSYYFEKQLEWDGICIEPVFEHYQALLSRRACTPVHGAVCSRSGRREFTDVIDTQGWSGFSDTFTQHHWDVIKAKKWRTRTFFINCYTLSDILRIFNVEHVNYLAIDVEGNEYSLLSSIDWEEIEQQAPIDVIQVEVNTKSLEIRELMAMRKYSDPFRIDKKHPDDIYIRQDLMPYIADSSPVVGCRERCRRVVSCDMSQWQRENLVCSDTKWV